MARSMLLASAAVGVTADLPNCDSFTVDAGGDSYVQYCPDYCVLSGASQPWTGPPSTGVFSDASCEDRSYKTQRAYANSEMLVTDADECEYYAEVKGKSYVGAATDNTGATPGGCYFDSTADEVKFNSEVPWEVSFDFTASAADSDLEAIVRDNQCTTLFDCQDPTDSDNAFPISFMWDCVQEDCLVDADVSFVSCYDNKCETACSAFAVAACPTGRCEEVSVGDDSYCAEKCSAHDTKYKCSEAAAISAIDYVNWGPKCVWDSRNDVCEDSCAFTYEKDGDCPSSHCKTSLIGELNSEEQICQAKCEIFGSPPLDTDPNEDHEYFEDFSNCPSTAPSALVQSFTWPNRNTDDSHIQGRCQWFKGTCQDTCQSYPVEICPDRRCDASDGACKLPCGALTEFSCVDSAHSDRCFWISTPIPREIYQYDIDGSPESQKFQPLQEMVFANGYCKDRNSLTEADGVALQEYCSTFDQQSDCPGQEGCDWGDGLCKALPVSFFGDTAPTPAPTCAEDNANWYYGDIQKTCANFVAKDPRHRCRMKGRLIDSWQFGEGGTTVNYPQNNEYSIRVKASEACLTTCGGCGCSDDANWQVREGKTGKDCKWVAKKPQTRCDRVGIDAGNNKVLASEGCCYSCRAQENQFRPLATMLAYIPPVANIPPPL